MSNSINTNISAYFAQANITQASAEASSSVSRLSSGNRIVKASDDVAALATGTSLLTTVSALKSAQTNASQGTSLLQVADGALAQIQNILQQQKSIALQAGSGSLTNVDRGFLNQQFQALSQEIDSLSGSTTFNGVSLLDGSLSTGALVQNSTAKATAGSASINFTGNLANLATVIVNGVTLTGKTSPASTTDFQIGLTQADTVANLAAKLTSLSQTTTYAASLGQATYTAVGNAVQITSRTGGALDKTFTINTNGTATIGTGASVGGTFGDSSFNVFGTGFSSTTTVVSAATGVAATPFQVGDAITLTIGSSPTTKLYTIAASDTLQTIVTGINANTATTGITAATTFDAGSQKYNINLSYKNTTNAKVTLDAGTNYANGTYTLAGTNAGAGTHTSSYYANSIEAFSSDLGAGTVGNSVSNAGNATTAAIPFNTNNLIKAAINGQTAVVLYTVGAADKLSDIINGINANEPNTGVHAVGTVGGLTTTSVLAQNIELQFNGTDQNVTITEAQGTGANAANASVAPPAASTTLFNSLGAAANGTGLTQTVAVGLSGGQDNGLGIGSTSVTGTVGDSLVTGLAQNAAKVTISFPDVAAANLTAVGNFNSNGSVYLSVGGHKFAFTTTGASAKAADEITIGASLKDTLDNAVSTINNYLTSGAATGDVAYQLSQINIQRQGTTLVITGKNLTTPTSITGGTPAQISLSGFTNGAPVSNSGNLTNASNTSSTTYGVDATGVTNAAFTGTISGFTASYVSANTVNVQVKVGEYTYTATNVPTVNTSNQAIRFFSDNPADGTNGGYFDIQLAANQGTTVSNQADANTFAQRVNGVFNSLTFNQNRTLSSYTGAGTIVSGGTLIGSLIGSKVSAQLASFTANKLSNVAVTAPPTASGDANITLTIDGETFASGVGLGGKLGANQTYQLTSTSNATHFVNFTTGNSTIDISTGANASAVQNALAVAFGAGNGSAALTFQIGASTNDTIKVSVGSAKTTTLFGGVALDVSTQASASSASTVLDNAINTVTSLRSTIGALESQFNFASAALQTSVQNQDAARGELLDTNIATESTSFATSQVKLQAGISVLAQANQQLQALLKLIG